MRALRGVGVDCVVGAVSKMHRPASDKRRKNDRNDAEFLARQLAARNIVEVFVPDKETEAARNLSRVLEDIRQDLTGTSGTRLTPRAGGAARGPVPTGNGCAR